ncbi:hypothetical protein [aff. Roholtiella sp. LEGE 12411]|uniref:hypothetical protein n=1 Tax=aff. Roholtiella sp. LEGE 12411 TaxID=1828822 RepID=UPI00187F017A|nr:hypothetical protein [aff. Roholtiella sp. LEGE 12411]MBE9036013.1 hypothetical protein [aff. Roholtiella sp. LEGE 12411]
MFRKYLLVFSLVLMILFSAGSASAVEMSKEEIIKTLERNNLEKLVELVDKGYLVLDAKNTTVNQMKLIRKGLVTYDKTAENAAYWYRSMMIPEAQHLLENSYKTLKWNQKTFLGIAPSFPYASSYLTAKNPGITVEFGTDGNGWLYQQWSKDNTCQIKAEGGGTYGLGLTGTIASCDQKKFPSPVLALGSIFSDWMNSFKVTTKVIWVLLPR